MKILVVEGDNNQLLRLEKSLSDAGHAARRSHDGDSALAMYQKFCPFDVVVTESLLRTKAWIRGRVVEVEFIPEYDHRTVRSGTDLIECIRTIDPGQPFVMLAESESMLLPRGVPLLHKPYRIGRLLRMLASVRSQRLPLLDGTQPSSVGQADRPPSGERNHVGRPPVRSSQATDSAVFGSDRRGAQSVFP